MHFRFPKLVESTYGVQKLEKRTIAKTKDTNIKATEMVSLVDSIFWGYLMIFDHKDDNKISRN